MRRPPRPKILLFYNPFSGLGFFQDNIDFVIGKAQAKGYQIIPLRAGTGDIIGTFLDEIDPLEYREIIVSGGDGTLNMVINAMLSRGINLPIAIFPNGTSNDFAKYFGLTDDFDEMLDTALGDNISYADIGLCNGKYFINVASLGNLINVAHKTNPNLKNMFGKMSYLATGIGDLHNLKPIPVKLRSYETVYEETMFFMVIMNGKAVGGFNKLSPHSDVDDGLFDVFLFRVMPAPEFAALLVKVLSGKHPKSKNVLALQTDSLIIESPYSIHAYLDGEVEMTTPLQLRIMRRKLKVFTPVTQKNTYMEKLQRRRK